MTGSTIELVTPDGRLAGRARDGVAVFLGVPYARAPVGPLRLASPRPPEPWTGVRRADAPGPASLQTLGGNQTWLTEPIAAQSEDCLYLNVWSPDVRGAHPVLVWLHGGATRNGHGATAAVDGARLAREQGLVVVTLNYRLGALGGLAHPALADAVTGTCANWGLQDKLAALGWVQRSIAAFGGDPARVTLAGQSSGAANAAIIVQNALAPAAVHGLILQSPPLFRPPMFVELEAAVEYTELVAARLGVGVPGLREVDGVVLQKAEQQLAGSPELAASMGRPRTAPVRDGRLIRAWPYDAAPFDLPLLAGWTRDESHFWFDLHDADGRCLSPQRPPASTAEFERRAAGLTALHYAFEARPPVAALVDAYASGTGDDHAEAWRALYTDLVFRAPILHLIGRQAGAGRRAWAHEFTHDLPAPGRGAPHASDVPFVFGTTGAAHLAAKVGTGPAVDAQVRATMDAWGAFVRDGDPGAPWPAFDPGSPQVMRFGPAAGAVAALEGAARLALWPAYGF